MLLPYTYIEFLYKLREWQVLRLVMRVGTRAIKQVRYRLANRITLSTTIYVYIGCGTIQVADVNNHMTAVCKIEYRRYRYICILNNYTSTISTDEVCVSDL